MLWPQTAHYSIFGTVHYYHSICSTNSLIINRILPEI